MSISKVACKIESKQLVATDHKGAIEFTMRRERKYKLVLFLTSESFFK